ncbi:MAG TPA: hypothetical protein VLR27_12860, partial [Acidimicrobiales bacterium]|nr:hypothetical protein [Acidimicrobiales bacterium]
MSHRSTNEPIGALVSVVEQARDVTTAQRRDLAGWVAGLLALVTTAATFLDWGRSGQRVRTSYELVDVADRAGVLADDAAWAA